VADKIADGGAVLTKMIEASQLEGKLSDTIAMTALNISTGKVTHDLFEVDAIMENGSSASRTRAELLNAAPTPGLLMIVKASTRGIGLLSFDSPMMNALVELSTGAARSSVCLDVRSPTPIDAALCLNFCEKLLGSFPKELTKLAGYSALPDLSFLRHETDVTRLIFALNDTVFRELSGHISFQGGIRGGNISLYLPQKTWFKKRKNGAIRSDKIWSEHLLKNVMNAPLLLRADLDTIKLSLFAALSLKPSDIIPVSPVALSSIDLVTDRGVGLLTGRLGQMNGKKAVCASSPYKGESQITTSVNMDNTAQLAQIPNPNLNVDLNIEGITSEFDLDADMLAEGVGS